MRSDLFQPTAAGEARLLLLIHAFSGPNKLLEGRTKLAKLDFLLRYPTYLQRALDIRRSSGKSRMMVPIDSSGPIENRMVRYRYGPWDPAYYALLGRLVSRGLIEPAEFRGGIGYRTTEAGSTLASALSRTEAWQPIAESARILKQNFDLSGTSLKNFIYQHFPEVTQANWDRSFESQTVNG